MASKPWFTIIVLSLFGVLSLACEELPVGNSGEEYRLGNIGVTVEGYDLRYLDFQDRDGSVLTTDDPILLLNLSITNHGSSAFRWDTRNNITEASQETTPLLFVDPGPEIEWRDPRYNVPLIAPDEYTFLEDPVTEATVIQRGETIEDVLLFEAPPDDTIGLILSLPPSLFGPEIEQPGLIRITYAPPRPSRPPVYDMGETVEANGYTLTVERTDIAYFPDIEHTGFTQEPVFAVYFTIVNTSEEAVMYLPPQRNPDSEVAPALGSGQVYWERVQLDGNRRIDGPLPSGQRITPGESVSDVVLFKRPTPDTTTLTFIFRGHVIGQTGQIRVRLPYEYSDPPLPPELVEPPPGTEGEEGEQEESD